MCSPRQLFFFQCEPEMPKGWTPLDHSPSSGLITVHPDHSCATTPGFIFPLHSACISDYGLCVWYTQLYRSFCDRCLSSNVISSEMNSCREDFPKTNFLPQTLHHHLLFSSYTLLLTEIISVT